MASLDPPGLAAYISRSPDPGAIRAGLPARWQSGYAEACKALYVGSIPARASRRHVDIGNQETPSRRSGARCRTAPGRSGLLRSARDPGRDGVGGIRGLCGTRQRLAWLAGSAGPLARRTRGGPAPKDPRPAISVRCTSRTIPSPGVSRRLVMSDGSDRPHRAPPRSPARSIPRPALPGGPHARPL